MINDTSDFLTRGTISQPKQEPCPKCQGTGMLYGVDGEYPCEKCQAVAGGDDKLNFYMRDNSILENKLDVSISESNQLARAVVDARTGGILSDDAVRLANIIINRLDVQTTTPIPQPEAAKVALDMLRKYLGTGEQTPNFEEENNDHYAIKIMEKFAGLFERALQTPASDGVLEALVYLNILREDYEDGEKEYLEMFDHIKKTLKQSTAKDGV